VLLILRRTRQMPVGDDHRENVYGDDHDECDVPVERVGQERGIGVVVVVERIVQMDRPAFRARRVADQREEQLSVDDQVAEVVRQQITERDRHQTRQQSGQRPQRSSAVHAGCRSPLREAQQQRREHDRHGQERQHEEPVLLVRPGDAVLTRQVA